MEIHCSSCGREWRSPDVCEPCPFCGNDPHTQPKPEDMHLAIAKLRVECQCARDSHVCADKKVVEHLLDAYGGIIPQGNAVIGYMRSVIHAAGDKKHVLVAFKLLSEFLEAIAARDPAIRKHRTFRMFEMLLKGYTATTSIRVTKEALVELLPPERAMLYVNVYEGHIKHIHASAEEARSRRNHGCVECVHFIEVGREVFSKADDIADAIAEIRNIAKRRGSVLPYVRITRKLLSRFLGIVATSQKMDTHTWRAFQALDAAVCAAEPGTAIAVRKAHIRTLLAEVDS